MSIEDVAKILESRGAAYGGHTNFEVTGEMWSAYLKPKLKKMCEDIGVSTEWSNINLISTRMAAEMMAIHKIARMATSPKPIHDHYDDGMGYIELALRIAMEEMDAKNDTIDKG